MPDALHQIHRVLPNSLTLELPAGVERDRLVQAAHIKPEALEDPLLRAPAVRGWLRAALDQPTPLDIWLYPGWIIGLDFARRVAHLFYMDDPGPDDAALEKTAVGDDSEPGRCFRTHLVTPDPWKAAPLPEEERARFAQHVQFSPPQVVDHPLVRALIVREQLRTSIEQSHEIVVSTQVGGLMVWTVDECVIDFYYSLGFDNPRESRVAGSYQRVFCAFLPDFFALPVHSSGVIRDGRAALFLAPDSGGKTTVLQMAREGRLLNDDQVIVRREGDAFTAHATPFGRLTSGPGQARLGGLFVLEKAFQFELTPLRPAILVKTLWDEHLFYTSSLPRHLKLRAFDLFYEMCHHVPAYRMRFPKDYVDWEAIDAAMGV